MNNPHIVHPVILFALEADDPEFPVTDAAGRSPRFLIEQVDGDKLYFSSREAAEEFMAVHGMVAVGDTEMERLRNELQEE